MGFKDPNRTRDKRSLRHVGLTTNLRTQPLPAPRLRRYPGEAYGRLGRGVPAAAFRGGIREPPTRDEPMAKFQGNVADGGASTEYGQSLLDFCLNLNRRKEVSRLTEVDA